MINFLSVLQGLNQGVDFIDKILNIGRTISILGDTTPKSSLDYITLNTTKETTVYHNGHGVLTYTYTFYVINPEKFEYFDGKSNIEDACESSIFPSLEQMINCDMDKRFEKFGFWYSCSENIVNRVSEYYWSDNNHENIDYVSQKNPRELRWRFHMNTFALKHKGVYTLTYAISIPGMFPITNFKYDSSIAGLQTEKMSSSINVEHYMRSLTYIVSFEKGIDFKDVPTGELYITLKNNKSKGDKLISNLIPNVFYTKYKFSTNVHKQFGNVTISWTIH